jgi:hypothetical protein
MHDAVVAAAMVVTGKYAIRDVILFPHMEVGVAGGSIFQQKPTPPDHIWQRSSRC